MVGAVVSDGCPGPVDDGATGAEGGAPTSAGPPAISAPPTSTDTASAAPPSTAAPAVAAAAEQIWTEPCISGGTPVPPATDVFRPGADLGPLNAALRASASNEVTTSVPVLLPQGGNDVLSSLNEGLARQLCEKGTSVEFKFYVDQGHTIGGGPLDDAIAWLDARRAGEPVTGSCVF
ncbi:hypothetical protein [Streptodolium elevatio]